MLAGFIKDSEAFIKAFLIKLSISILRYCPKFGGKGMYGINVHKAVIEKKKQKAASPFIM